MNETKPSLGKLTQDALFLAGQAVFFDSQGTFFPSLSRVVWTYLFFFFFKGNYAVALAHYQQCLGLFLQILQQPELGEKDRVVIRQKTEEYLGRAEYVLFWLRERRVNLTLI